MLDYVKIYSLETYLFEEVAERFRRTGVIEPGDFYMIIIWKSNRAKTRTSKRLINKAGSFPEAAKRISTSLHAIPEPERKLELLMKEWGFQLPMASAILTVLYPDEFTAYDVRVCDELGAFHELAAKPFSTELWTAYVRFLQAVKTATPQHLSLRDKDRYLWARSFYNQVHRAIETREALTQS